jgi:hypothetical protein
MFISQLYLRLCHLKDDTNVSEFRIERQNEVFYNYNPETMERWNVGWLNKGKNETLLIVCFRSMGKPNLILRF